MIQFNSDPVVPYVYGKNKAGMSQRRRDVRMEISSYKLIWKYVATSAFTISKLLSKLDYTSNGLIVLLNHLARSRSLLQQQSGITFWLRDDPEAAQPEIVALARLMKNKIRSKSSRPS